MPSVAEPYLGLICIASLTASSEMQARPGSSRLRVANPVGLVRAILSGMPRLHLRALLGLVWLAAVASGQIHTHGDMVGSLSTSGAVVWTRSSSAADVSVLYATDPKLTNAVETKPVRSGASLDFTVRMPLSGLAAGKRYYYRTKIADPANSSRFVLGALGTFLTPPTGMSAATFCVIADVKDPTQYSMFDRVLAHEPELCLSLGDYPYADGTTLASFWAKHRAVRNHAKIWHFFRQMGTACTWDDHEVANDWDARTDKTIVSNGVNAWRHYFPLPLARREIYHSLRWGAAVEVFVLDARRHRGSNPAPDLASKSMLGAAQKAWLKGALANSTATFKLVCTSVPLRYGTTGRDSWTGYQRERQELLAFIRDKNVRNVVFFSADQHWAAVHHHREGVREYQSGPIATTTRPPLPFGDPERRATWQEINYAIVKVDPRSTPATLSVELHGAKGLLAREVIRDEAPARVKIQADLPEAGFAMSGPVLFRNSGREVERAHLEPGAYTLAFDPVHGVPTIPSSLAVKVKPGADLRVAARWRDVPDTKHPVLFADSFERGMRGYAVVDEGTTDAPSAWFTANGYLQQSSNIYGGSTSASDPVKPGTMALTGSTSWTDYTVTCRIRSKDDDACGAVFRYRDRSNYLRFSWDRQRKYARLTKKTNGVVSVLAQRAWSYTQHKFHDLRITAVGKRLTVYIDGVQALVASDGDHAAGRIGLYTWGNHITEFDDLTVRKGGVPPPAKGGLKTIRPVLTAQLVNGVTELVGRHPGSAGRPYVLALALSKSPSIPLSLLQPPDPRVIELAPDGLFFLSLAPVPIFRGFTGKLDANGYFRGSITWPPLGLKGLVLQCGGWIVDPRSGKISEVIPTVQVVLP